MNTYCTGCGQELDAEDFNDPNRTCHNPLCRYFPYNGGDGGDSGGGKKDDKPQDKPRFKKDEWANQNDAIDKGEADGPVEGENPWHPRLPKKK